VLILLALATLSSSLACGSAGSLADDVVAEWKVTPAAPVVNVSAQAEISLVDRSRQPVTGASVQIEVHMSHPGMTPVIQAAREERPGVYSASMSFSMSGDWTVVVAAELKDRRRLRQRVGNLTVRPAG
jgi:hypothetical protein